MNKIKITGFGNDKNFYYFILKKKGYSFKWRDEFFDLIRNLSSGGSSDHVSPYNAEKFLADQMIDKHESCFWDTARIDLFYGQDIIYLAIVSSHIKKKELLEAIENVADFTMK